MADIQSLITDNLDVWTSALMTKSGVGRGSSKKFNLYGIKKLRELILELAVRGKLVPQDSNDEPASVLLEKIATEKAQLIKDQKIKKGKKLPEITDAEKPFELPQGWAWTKLGEVAEFINGYAFKSADFSEIGVGIVKIGDIQLGEISTSGMSRVPENIVSQLPEDLKVSTGDLMIAMSGATTGKLGFNRSDETFYLNQRVGKISPYHISYDYLYFPLTTKIAENLAQSLGSAIPNLSTSQIKNICFALPPLSEQHRIVAKVDELMALCDTLEQETEDSITEHKTMAEVLLKTLTDSANAAELTENWNRISDHFDTLFNTEYSIEQLKQTILQLAVMGKLVLQDSTDEPASILLEKIAAEKAQLIKDKKIKKQKPLLPITDEQKGYDLPQNWEAIRLGEVINLISGQHLKPHEYSETKQKGMIPYLTGPAEFGKKYPCASRYTNEKRAVGLAGNILVTCKGSGVGKLNEVNEEIAISRQLMAIQPIIVHSQYIKLLAQSIHEHLRANIVGIAIPGISREDVTEAPVLFAPLAEQHRIVAKVDELMTLCDQLKERLADGQTTQLHLADALVEQSVN